MMYWFPPSKPIKVKGGIKAQLGRPASMNWWTRQWVELLDDFDIGERVSRGRSYARKGQVRSLTVKGGEARASVQGSMSGAYDVSIKIDVIGQQKWQALSKAIFEKPASAASLLAGRMPEDIEKAFKSAGMRLFPRKGTELDTECTCPDWSNPCKHTVAVFFLLASEFERDPFMIFKLRGSGRDELARMAEIRPPRKKPRAARAPRARPEASAEPLPPDPSAFWGPDPGPYDPGDAFIPGIQAALPKQLGGFPFWRGGEDFIGAMEEAYRSSSEAAMDVFLGEGGK